MSEIDNAARRRILDKIQKCFNLGASSEPHEAAAAMRQAQKLMHKHGVTEQELGMAGYGHEKVAVPLQVTRTGVLPVRLAGVVDLMQRAFGVRAVIGVEKRISDFSYTVTYVGPKDRVVLSAYSHKVVWRAMDAAWANRLKNCGSYTHDQLREATRPGQRAGFDVGYIESVSQQVMDMVVTDDEKQSTDVAVAEKFSQLGTAKISEREIDPDTVRDGMVAGKDFRLHKPIV